MTSGARAQETHSSPESTSAGARGGDRRTDAAASEGAVFELRAASRTCTLCDGTEVVIRPIHSHDCSSCSTMLTACSEESLYSRYERVVTESPDDLAAELCNPDPETVRTVVGEIRHGTFPTIIGIAQLLADPAHRVAEYAVLVADPWQNRGLGSRLTDTCLEIADRWGIPRVVAEFLPSNMRMIRILEKRAFDMSRDLQEHVVSGQKLFSDRT